MCLFFNLIKLHNILLEYFWLLGEKVLLLKQLQANPPTMDGWYAIANAIKWENDLYIQ